MSDCPIRWSSTYFMTERLLAVRASFNEVLAKQGSSLNSEWKKQKAIKVLLDPFLQHTKSLETVWVCHQCFQLLEIWRTFKTMSEYASSGWWQWGRSSGYASANVNEELSNIFSEKSFYSLWILVWCYSNGLQNTPCSGNIPRYEIFQARLGARSCRLTS